MIRNVVPSRRPSKLRGVISALSLSALALGAGPVAAQQQVTLSEAAQLMQSSELDLQLIELEQQVAQEVVNQAKGERRPRVRLSLRCTGHSRAACSRWASWRAGASCGPRRERASCRYSRWR